MSSWRDGGNKGLKDSAGPEPADPQERLSAALVRRLAMDDNFERLADRLISMALDCSKPEVSLRAIRTIFERTEGSPPRSKIPPEPKTIVVIRTGPPMEIIRSREELAASLARERAEEEGGEENSKFEARNSKQIRISKSECRNGGHGATEGTGGTWR